MKIRIGVCVKTFLYGLEELTGEVEDLMCVIAQWYWVCVI
jgi:hypothetical protein